MKKRGIFMLFLCCFFLVGCGEEQEINDATREPMYTDMEARQIHDKIVENFNFVPTCDEYKQCLDDYYVGCMEILIAFRKDPYLHETRQLFLDLAHRLEKIGENVKNPKYYDGLQKGREEKIDKEIEECKNKYGISKF